MAVACEKFPFEATWPIYQQWAADEAEAVRYWPWIALAADLYSLESETKAKYGKEPKPSEVLALLNNVATKAQNLRSDLMELDELSRRLSEPKTLTRRAHLAWLREIISQSLAAGCVVEPTDKPEAVLFNAAMYETWARLELLKDAALSAVNQFEPNLLARTRTQSDKGLAKLVSRAEAIWRSLRGREPSVNKSVRQGADNDKSPFARFVTNIARLATGHEPTADEIATASKHRQLRKK
jgi:hypothetical protein